VRRRLRALQRCQRRPDLFIDIPEHSAGYDGGLDPQQLQLDSPRTTVCVRSTFYFYLLVLDRDIAANTHSLLSSQLRFCKFDVWPSFLQATITLARR